MLFAIEPAFADEFYFTRTRALGGVDPANGETGLFRWNDATNAQSQIGGDGIPLRHATDGRMAVDAIATNLSGALYGFAIDDTSTAGFLPWSTEVVDQCKTAQRSRLVSINATTAVITYVGTSWLSGRQITGAGFDGQGRLWVYDCVSASVLQISPATGGIVGSSIPVGVAGLFGYDADLDFAANGTGIIGYGGLQFRAFDPDTGWVADVPTASQNSGFDGTLVPPYLVPGVAFTNHRSARNGSPAAQACRLNISEIRGTDELGHVNDPFFANPLIAHKDVNQYNPPNVANHNGGPSDLARVGRPALPDCLYDWGDAPSSYGTLRANTGASHLIATGGPYLGVGMPDFEVDGQPSAGATGDDAANIDDEDGAVVPALPAGATVQVQATAGNVVPGTRLQGWIDWGQDGSFAQAGDRILTDATVVSGTNTFNVAVPATAVVGTTYARFRIANQTGLGVAGLAASGEVEDYQVQVAAQPPFTCDASMYLTQGDPTGLYKFDTSSNPFPVQPVGPVSTVRHNGAAFSPTDNYIYAIRFVPAPTNVLLRIGSDGSVRNLGAITGLPDGGGYGIGEIAPDGSYYVKNAGTNNLIYRVNIAARTAAPITLSQAFDVHDLAWHNGLLYGASPTTGLLYSIDPANGTATSIGFTGVAGLFGAMFGASNGLYGGNNNGGFYQFNLTTGAATLISDLPGSSNNDGAKCATTALNFAADLAITKDDGSTTYTPGSNVTYSIVVSNAGPYGVQNAVVSDALPTGITTANWACATTAGGGVCGATSGSGAINTTASLPVGASVTYTLTLTVPSTFSGNLVNTATVTAPAGTNDSNQANNSATDTDTQFPLPAPNVANLSCSSDASLFNTAYDGSGGRLTSGTDTYWQVALTTTPITGAPPGGLSYGAAAVLTNPPALYIVSPYNNANWISHAADGAHTGNYDVFYRYQFNLGPGTNPATFRPRLDFYSDNSVYEIWVNGTRQNIQSNFGADAYNYAGFQTGNGASGTLTGPWNSGFNEIVVHLKSGAPVQAFLAQVVLPQSICAPATVTLNKTTRLVTGGPFGFGLTNTAQGSGSVGTTAVDAPAQVDGDSSSAGTAEPFAITAFGTDVVITENTLPAGWLLSDAVCTSGGTPIGSRSGSAYVIPGSLIDADAESFVCTFTNTPTTNLRIAKAVTPTTTRTGETVTYTIDVNNDGPGPGDDAVMADPAVAGVDCTTATLTCSASGGAACPASLDVTALQSTGLVIPTFPVGGALQFGMACMVTATGQ